jgi:hypothetical protein
MATASNRIIDLRAEAIPPFAIDDIIYLFISISLVVLTAATTGYTKDYSNTQHPV